MNCYSVIEIERYTVTELKFSLNSLYFLYTDGSQSQESQWN